MRKRRMRPPAYASSSCPLSRRTVNCEFGSGQSPCHPFRRHRSWAMDLLSADTTHADRSRTGVSIKFRLATRWRSGLELCAGAAVAQTATTPGVVRGLSRWTVAATGRNLWYAT